MNALKAWLLGFAVLGCSVHAANQACIRACDDALIQAESAAHSECAHCIEGRDSAFCPSGVSIYDSLATCETVSDQNLQPSYDSCTNACLPQ